MSPREPCSSAITPSSKWELLSVPVQRRTHLIIDVSPRDRQQECRGVPSCADPYSGSCAGRGAWRLVSSARVAVDRIRARKAVYTLRSEATTVDYCRRAGRTGHVPMWQLRFSLLSGEKD